MSDKNVLHELSDIKLQIQTLCTQLEMIKKDIPSELREGINIACSIAPELELVISLQQDLLVYSQRNETEALNYAKAKLAKLAE